MKPQDKTALILASSFFLSDKFPNEIDEMEELEINEFIEENSWGALNGLSIEDVWGQIECLADNFIQVDNKGLTYLSSNPF